VLFYQHSNWKALFSYCCDTVKMQRTFFHIAHFRIHKTGKTRILAISGSSGKKLRKNLSVTESSNYLIF